MIASDLLLSLFPEGIPPQIYPKLPAIENKIDELIGLCNTCERIVPSDQKSNDITKRIVQLYNPEAPNWTVITKQINQEFQVGLSEMACRSRFYDHRKRLKRDVPQEATECPKEESDEPTTNEPQVEQKALDKNPGKTDEEIEAEIIRLCDESANKRLNGKADLKDVAERTGINFYRVRSVWAQEGLRRRRAPVLQEQTQDSTEKVRECLARGMQPMEIAGYLTVPLADVYRIQREEHA